MRRLLLFLLLFLAVPFVSAALDTDLTAYYTFDDGNLSGSDAVDVTGNGWLLSNTAVTTGVTGKLLEAFDFANAHVDSDLFATSSPMSLSVWVNMDVKQTWNTIGCTGSTQATQKGICLLIRDTGDLWFFTGDGTSSAGVQTTANLANINTWYHVVLTWDGTTSANKLILYVDGVQSTWTASYAWTGNSSYGWKMGAYFQSPSYFGFMNGQIDEAGLWGRILNQSEVNIVYNSSVGCSYYGCVTVPSPPVSVSFASVVVKDSFDNATLSGLTVGIGDKSNVTDGSGVATVYNNSGVNFTVDGSPHYFNVSGTAVENSSVDAFVYGAFYNLTAFDVLGNVVSSFSVSSGGQSNSSVGSLAMLLLKPNSSNEVVFSKSGWFNVSLNVSAGSRDLGVANTTNMHDNEFSVSAIDALDNASISSFSLNSSNVSESYSSSFSTSSGVVVVPLMQGFSYNFLIDALGYAFANSTLSANASNNSFEFSLFRQNSIFFFFFDEVTLASITENVSVAGINGNLTYQNYSVSGELFINNLTAGTWTFTVDAPSYDERQYFLTITDRSTQDLDVFLLNSSLSQTTTFTIKNADTADVIPNATITMQQKVGPNWVTVDQQVSGAFGIAVFRLLIEGTYRFTIDAPGFITKVDQVFIQTQSSYIISLKADNAQSFNTYLDDFTYSLSPDGVVPDNVTFSIIASSPIGVIDWFSVSVLLNGSTTVSNVTASPSGGTAAVVLNLSGFGGETVKATYRVKSQNFVAPLVVTRNFFIYEIDSGNYTLSSFMVFYADDTNGLSNTSRALLLTFLAILLALSVGAFFGFEAAVFLAAIIYIVGSFYGWLNWSITIVVVTVTLGLLFLGGRR